MLDIDQPRIRLSTRINLLLVAILNLGWFLAVANANFAHYAEQYGYTHHVPITLAIGGLSLVTFLSASAFSILNSPRLCKNALVVAMVINALAMLIAIAGEGIGGDFWVWWFIWVAVSGLCRWLFERSLVHMIRSGSTRFVQAIRHSELHNRFLVAAVVLAILTGVSSSCLPYFGGFSDDFKVFGLYHPIVFTNARWTLLCAVMAFTGILTARKGGAGGMKPRTLFMLVALAFVGAFILTTIDFFVIAGATFDRLGMVGIGIWMGLSSSVVGTAVAAVLVATQDDAGA